MVNQPFSVNMYYSSPIRLAKSNIEKLNFCHFFNVVCDGSDLTIYSISGSAAETRAEELGLRFVSIGDTALSAKRFRNEVTYSAIQPAASSAMVLIARYDEQGRFLGVEIQPAEGSASGQADAKDAYTCEIFLVDPENLAPKCPEVPVGTYNGQ